MNRTLGAGSRPDAPRSLPALNPLRAALLAIQGWWAKRTIELLPPAEGPTSGSVGDLRAGEALRVGFLGESTAAGCGVNAHQKGLPGSLAWGLLEPTGNPIEWDVVGQLGATARRIRHRLLPRLDGQYDLVVVLAGANDVLGRRRMAEWREDLTAILDDLETHATQVVVVGTPPFASFPSLPRALRQHLAAGGEALDAVTREVCDSRSKVTWVGSPDVGVDPRFFAADGFHPSAHGYWRWAQVILQGLPPTTDQHGPSARGASKGP